MADGLAARPRCAAHAGRLEMSVDMVYTASTTRQRVDCELTDDWRSYSSERVHSDDNVGVIALERHTLPIADQAVLRHGAEPVGASRHARTDPALVPQVARKVHVLDRGRRKVAEPSADGRKGRFVRVGRVLVEVVDRVALDQRRVGEAVDLVSQSAHLSGRPTRGHGPA